MSRKFKYIGTDTRNLASVGALSPGDVFEVSNAMGLSIEANAPESYESVADESVAAIVSNDARIFDGENPAVVEVAAPVVVAPEVTDREGSAVEEAPVVVEEPTV